MPNSVTRILCGVILALLTGCVTVGPDYKRPAIDTPAAWRFEEKEVRDLANTAWWQQFKDPVLDRLVSQALQENKDLLIATYRIEEFFGRYFSTRGDQFPSAGANGDAFRQRLSEKGFSRFDGKDNPYNQYEAFLNAGWEIDFWGKFRRATEAARAELLGTEEARRTVVLTLVSAVAASYVDIRSLDKQLTITAEHGGQPQGHPGAFPAALPERDHLRGGLEPGGVGVRDALSAPSRASSAPSARPKTP